MKRTHLSLPKLKGRLLDVSGHHVWAHAHGGPLEATLKGGDAEIEESDDAVRLSLRQKGFWFPRGDLSLSLPPGSRVRFRHDAGGLRAESLNDVDLDFRTQAGTMHVSRMIGRLHLHTTSGTIHVEQLSGAFNVETMAGTIHLEIDDLVAGHHRARTYAGSLHVELAPHIEAQIDARATFGAVRNQARSYVDSAVQVQLISDVGGVRVLQEGAPRPQKRAPHLSMTQILERVSKGALGVEEAEVLLDRLERQKREHK